MEETNHENVEEEWVEEEEEEEDEEEGPEEEEEKEEDASSSQEDEEADDDNELDPWRPLSQKVGEDIKKLTWKKSNSSWIEENPNTMPKMPLVMPFYL